uniref:FCP1 homology domain-containing protein n=1 Tax=viral metagenome TaxID=1070528 RepID=A0A6C0J4W1_9ZZZZ
MNIVLDLDETLVSVSSKPYKSYDFSFELGTFKYYAKKRPNLTLFLRYIFKYFNTVNVWTAATRPYAEQILNNILNKTQLLKLNYFLTREDLLITKNGDISKPLQKIFKSPSNKKGLRPNNTIMIDDKKSAVINNLGNAIIVPVFKGSTKDIALAKLMIVLDGILKYGPEMSLCKYKKEFTLNELTKL